MSSEGSLIVLSAPSGSGKTSLAERVLPQLTNIRFSVSHTTRCRRRNEIAGREYFFVSVPEFKKMISEDQFLEWAEVYGNYYGTSREFITSQLSAGNDVLLDIDIQGALKVRRLIEESVMVFVLPPSFEVLERRLRNRGLDDEEVIERRLQIARDEIRHFSEYDYVIINRDLDRSVEELKSIIRASRCRVGIRVDEAESIVRTFLAG